MARNGHDKPSNTQGKSARAVDWRLRFGPLLTPLFRTWWRFSRPMTLGVRGIACDGEGRVLLVRHTYSKGWHLPGGGVEHGETAIDAIVREMAEEGGVDAIGAPKLVGFYSNHAHYAHDHVALYRFDTWRPCAWLENGEIAERGFFPAGALPPDTKPAVRRRIAELFDGAPPSATW